MTAFLRKTNKPQHLNILHIHYSLFSRCVLNQMTGKVSKLCYKFAKNVTQKFANIRRKILIILLSKFHPKFYNVHSKTCCRKKQSCRKKALQFSQLSPKEKD